MPRIPVFTAEEVQSLRTTLDRYREPGAYEPGRWSVSPLNRCPEVAGTWPERVILRDIAARTTEQMPGVVLPAEDRMRLLRAVVEAGVPSVQVGAFGRGRSRAEMRADVMLIKGINPACEVVYGGVRSRDDIALAAGIGIDSVQLWRPHTSRRRPSRRPRGSIVKPGTTRTGASCRCRGRSRSSSTRHVIWSSADARTASRSRPASTRSPSRRTIRRSLLPGDA